MTETLREVGQASTSAVSQRIAAEIRAEAARRGISIREIARRMEVSQMWLSRRVKVSADVDLKVNEIDSIAETLGTTSEKLLLAARWPTCEYPIAEAA